VGQQMRAMYSKQKGLVFARRAGNLKGHAKGQPTTLMDDVLYQEDKLQLTDHQQSFLGILMEGGSDTISTMP
jgi:hypothetical protein